MSHDLYLKNKVVAQEKNDEKEKLIPKFGEWDVNDPATAEGFTVIFARARDEKKIGRTESSESVKYCNKHDRSNKHKDKLDYSKKRKWLCCG